MRERETVLITGGTSVIGQAIIPALTGKGYEVVFTSRKAESRIGNAVCIQADLLEENGPEALISELARREIAVSHLINNFRDVDNLKTDKHGEPGKAQWMREYEAAVSVPYALGAALAKTGTLKSIVNVTSIYGIAAANLNLYQGDQRLSPIHYNVAKAAEVHLTKEMAVRMAGQNIRVNAVAYGGVKGRASPDFEKTYASLCPFEGMLETGDLAGAILFLLSGEQAGKITGQTIQVDGGWTLW